MEVKVINNQDRAPLFEAMKKYNDSEVVPFDVPGHKHGKGLEEFTEYFGERVMKLDVNSMKELDNLSNPIGVIKEAQGLMAEAYGADYAHFLVNGTSSGIQAMIMSVCNPGDKIIIPRNAHKSAFNGLILSGANPVYVYPEVHGELGIACNVTLESVEKTLNNNEDVKAIFLINPTYYGMTCNLREIIKLCHERNILVLVDEAHGAHLAFNNELPESAMKLGADMAAISLHKTGGSLTQSSVLLVNEGRVKNNRVKGILNLTQTTSASYLLMSSLDVARKKMACIGNKELSRIIYLTEEARKIINKMDGLYAFGKELIGEEGICGFDNTKLGINVKGIGLSGFEVYDILRDQYNIQVELADMDNILAIISIGDDEHSLNKLIKALECLSKLRGNALSNENSIYDHIPKAIMTPREAFYSDSISVPILESEKCISSESIMVYPPGIPIVAPGEEISIEIIEYINKLKEKRVIFNGLEDEEGKNIRVIKR